MIEIFKSQPDDYLDTLLMLRYGYREEIPNHMLSSIDGNYKIRMGWFTAIRNMFSDMGYNDYPQKDIEPVAKEFVKWVSDILTTRPAPRMCKREDIEYANNALDKAIESYGTLPPKI